MPRQRSMRRTPRWKTQSECGTGTDKSRLYASDGAVRARPGSSRACHGVLLLDRKWPVAKIQVYESPGIRTGAALAVCARCGARTRKNMGCGQALANAAAPIMEGYRPGQKPRLDASAFPVRKNSDGTPTGKQKKRRPRRSTKRMLMQIKSGGLHGRRWHRMA
jgi:hypothetical protein